MITRHTKKIVSILSLVALLGTATLLYIYSHQQEHIYEYDPTRDMKPILELFDQNRYWLLSNEDSSPLFMLKNRTPNENPRYFGALKIKTLYKGNQLAGFTAYYMKEAHVGQLLFLAVGHSFRGKGYGKKLAEYAIDDLIKLGAHKIVLWTRVSNIPAQNIYKNLGFVEVLDTGDGYLYFERWYK